ncbi:centromere protein B, putative [Ixodes scapularis]|uniref:Centromere protein B, putative n=1 Tax=Ixodes scapularis TaxID=6945 RepID=B7PNK3_IXOSC|nr:centromere protein B, putative [Ixodes scapularis]|eukprot:XP_002435351.1 centromere protein B, putative [Ixodes scapularis]
MAMTRKRFHLQDDFVLLREVIKHNPFEDPDRWMNVVHTLRKETLKEFTVRGARERMDLLLSQWSDTDARERLKSRSANHEQYLEKEKLLQQVFDMEQQVYPKPRRVLYPRPRLKKMDVDGQTVVSPLGTTENSNGVVCHIVSYPDTYPVPETDLHDSVQTEFIEGYSLAGADPSVSSGEDTMEHKNGGCIWTTHTVLQAWLDKHLDQIFETYADCNIYYVDETGLLFQLFLAKTLASKDDKCLGTKAGRERVMVLVCANMDGGGKCKLLVIGKSHKPRGFAAMLSLPVTYVQMGRRG